MHAKIIRHMEQKRLQVTSFVVCRAGKELI